MFSQIHSIHVQGSYASVSSSGCASSPCNTWLHRVNGDCPCLCKFALMADDANSGVTLGQALAISQYLAGLGEPRPPSATTSTAGKTASEPSSLRKLQVFRPVYLRVTVSFAAVLWHCLWSSTEPPLFLILNNETDAACACAQQHHTQICEHISGIWNENIRHLEWKNGWQVTIDGGYVCHFEHRKAPILPCILPF